LEGRSMMLRRSGACSVAQPAVQLDVFASAALRKILGLT